VSVVSAVPGAGGALASVPFLRLDNAEPELFRRLMSAVEAVAARAAFTLGEEVEAFEHEFAAYCGTSSAIAVSSGTEALVLALRGLGIGSGDEVVVPANSFIATAEAVTLVGATPKIVDVDPVTGLLTGDILAAALGPRTRCVIPVHLHGATVDMDEVLGVARQAGIRVVEDACQAHGAIYNGRRVGALGDCGCFSFYPTKNLGAWGDGGAVTTSDPEVATNIRLLRSHGEAPGRRNEHHVPGTTARLDTVQAAILRIKLRELEARNDARRSLAHRLTEALADTDLVLPEVPGYGDHVFHLYVVRSDRRDELRAALAAEGIATAVHYPTPIHRTGAYASLGLRAGSLPTSERLASQICSLAFWPSMSAAELDRLVGAVRRCA
jgi:dTDP-3-amino-3,4,6-trideoxy-alpha-D-glucose transaminase